MLLGYGGLNLPYDVPANEYMNLEGFKLSTSRNWAIWLNDYLDRYEPDPLRYFIAANMPETSDSDFSWSEYVRRNNDELVATYGNLAHRVLTMAYRNFYGRVPEAAAWTMTAGPCWTRPAPASTRRLPASKPAGSGWPSSPP